MVLSSHPSIEVAPIHISIIVFTGIGHFGDPSTRGKVAELSAGRAAVGDEGEWRGGLGGIVDRD